MNALREALVDYLIRRRALGYKLARTEKLLAQFLTYLEEHGKDQLTTQAAVAWAALPAGASKLDVHPAFRRSPLCHSPARNRSRNRGAAGAVAAIAKMPGDAVPLLMRTTISEGVSRDLIAANAVAGSTVAAWAGLNSAGSARLLLSSSRGRLRREAYRCHPLAPAGLGIWPKSRREHHLQSTAHIMPAGRQACEVHSIVRFSRSVPFAMVRGRRPPTSRLGPPGVCFVGPLL